MKRRLFGSLVLVLGLALIITCVLWSGPAARVLGTCGCMMVFAGVAVWISTGLTSRSSALIRMDWYSPQQRQQRSKTDAATLPAAHTLPARAGRIRRQLRRLVPSVAASPLRRAIQAACFLLFLILFCYVCWPYNARPAPPGQHSGGWKFVEVDQQDGSFRLAHSQPPAWVLQENQTVHITDESVTDQVDGYIGAFHVVSHSAETATLTPASDSAAEHCDALLVSPGPWGFHEQEPGRWPSHYSDNLSAREFLPADLFLAIDPLVSVSTAIAARSWVWSLTSAAIILIICLLIPRGFCGYICPLGTTIDLFDWAVARRVSRTQVAANGWWVHVKYYLLAGILICSFCGILVSGFFAAIPVITRALLFVVAPFQTGLLRGWHLVPSMHLGHLLSVALFAVILALGFLRPRFWCRYVCPSGAVFSLGNLLRVTQRKVESSCIHCNKCVEICPFDAIKPDFTTRGTDCTFCQTCGGVCPTQAIKFVERWNEVSLKVENEPLTGETPLGRRGFLSLAAGSAAAMVGSMAAVGTIHAWGAQSDATQGWCPIRPPGSVPEREFLQLCIRCGECFQVCPNNVLQPEGFFQQGLEGLWTPRVVPDWAGCESSCNACGQVCPTGAIRALPLDEKRFARIGLAIVQEQTCLPLANRQACQLCVDECNAAGYRAIEFMRVHTQADSAGNPVEGTGFLAPIVSADRCVGCGLCQTRCHGINVKEKKLLTASAIVIEAGEGREDRLMTGSYRELRAAEAHRRERERTRHVPEGDADFFVPEVP